MTTASLLLLIGAAWSMLLGVRRRWPAGWLSEPLEHHARDRPDAEGEDDTDGEDEGGVGVREPRAPLPSTGGAAAHAEPDERAA